MSLVTYSDTEDDTEETSKEIQNTKSKPTSVANGTKRKRPNEDSQPPTKAPPPPLPSTFTTLYSTSIRSSTIDDPTLHSGRKRQIPHIEGNWPSFVYLEWVPSPSDLASLEDVIGCIAQEHTKGNESPGSKSEVRSSLRSELGVRLPLHVSLSAPLILTTTNKDGFEGSLSQTINHSNIAAFSTTPSSIKWVKNFDGTRLFLILTLSRPKHGELQSLLSLCNRTATNFRLPQLYARHSKTDTTSTTVGVATTSTVDTTSTSQSHTPNHDNFHISIAWSLSPINTTQTLLEKLQTKLKHINITFDTVLIKIGNHISSVPLRDQPSASPMSGAAADVANTHKTTS